MLSWEFLTEIKELDDIVQMSNNKPVIIFKHSTRCSISAMAKDRLERQWSPEESVPVFYLDLIRYRPVSDRIAEMFSVEHESPQVLLITNGKCTYHASHSMISATALREEISAVRS